jgi:hypothetical protein
METPRATTRSCVTDTQVCDALAVCDVAPELVASADLVVMEMGVLHYFVDLRPLLGPGGVVPRYDAFFRGPWTFVYEFWANIVRVWHGGDREWPLNDGQIPHYRGVRAHVSTGYSRAEGNRRASRELLSHPKSRKSRFAFYFAPLYTGCCGEAGGWCCASSTRCPPSW